MSSVATVVLLEGDEAVRRMMTALLRHYGHVSMDAASVEEAMMLCDADVRVDLVIVDVTLPREEITPLLRCLARGAHVPRVLLAGAVTADEFVGVARLDKPFTPQQLKRAIDLAFTGPTLSPTSVPP